MPSENKNAAARRPRRNRTIPDTPYLRSVLELYCRLPHTPDRPRPDDRFVVRRLELQQHPVQRVQAALLLGTVRRLFRVDDSDPLMPIRSIRFFLPIVDELRVTGLDPGYIDYLARKIRDATGCEFDIATQDPLPRRVPRQLDLPS
jgi:hypothetical protein